MPLTRRKFLSAGAIGSLLKPSDVFATKSRRCITPEQFGAKGDGRTNDTTAFAALAAFVERAGGGNVVLRKAATYIVGRQRATSGLETGYSFEPTKILEFNGLRSALTINGNGARLKASNGLRFGTFAAGTAHPTHHQMPYIQGGEIASPYRAMIKIENCWGPICISDLELDGNLAALRIGGGLGDTGWQIPAVGLWLRNNRGGERVARLASRNHALDGVQIDGFDGDGVAGMLEDVICERNGRQGCSIVGGRNYHFHRCHFMTSGKGRIGSPPGAGCDIEAEGGKTIRNLTFIQCEFADNSGAGLVADSGNSANVQFNHCLFIGTTNWAAWPNKPGFHFSACTFVGAIVHAFASEDPTAATQFDRCIFTDNVAASPTGRVYGADGSVPMVDLGGSYLGGKNIAFRNSRFVMLSGGKLPWTVGAVFENVTMKQTTKATAFPRGIFRGTNSIQGPVDLYSSRIEGTLAVNGKSVSN